LHWFVRAQRSHASVRVGTSLPALALALLVACGGGESSKGSGDAGGSAAAKASGGAAAVAGQSGSAARAGNTSGGTSSSGGAAGAGGTSGGTSSSGGTAGAGGTSGGTSSSGGTAAGSSAGPSSAGAGGELTPTAGQPNGGTGGAEPSAGSSGKAETGRGGEGGAEARILESVDISDVWSGHPVGFYLITHGDRQFAAFYDANRALTVAERTLGSKTWRLERPGTSVGWDSHNDLVMAIDADGFIHLAGNMHSTPLIYFRTKSPLDIGTFERLDRMTGTNEERCTYPQFFSSAAGELIFMYRDGESGNGNHIFNAYSPSTKSWRRLLGTGLTDGQGERNAYPVGPIHGPDGLWHLVWVWRETADASTNHDLSYARTTDLVNWQAASGRALTVPVQLSSGDIVDPVPVGAGMINNNTKVGFDAQKRPIVAYHKYDASGYTQLYNARFENGAWVVHQTSSWTYRWSFGGVGTLVFEIEVEPVELQADGSLTQNFYHSRYGGRGAFRLNPTTLAAEASIPQPVPYPPELTRVESTTAQMEVRWRKDSGKSPDADVVYLLRWETLPSNRDQPRSPIPPPTKLRLYGFRAGD
jgi:hypothetical protein